MAFSDLEIRNAFETSLAQGFTPEQIYQGALANFGVSKEQVDRALSNSNAFGKVQEVLANSQAGYNPEMAYTPVGQFVVDGKTYTVNPDGSYYANEDIGSGNVASQVYDASGNLTKDFTYNRNESTYLTPVVNSLMAAAGAAVLGPGFANSLGFSAPVAAAAGSGGTTLLRGGSLEDALKSAALGGAAAYGVGSLFGGTPSVSVDDFLAADVAQLAAQGIPEEQIAQLLTQEGVSNAAASAALDQVFGTSATGSAKGLGDFTSTGGESVPVSGTGLFNPATLTSPLVSSLASLAGGTPQVQVTGQTFPKTDLGVPEVSAALSTALPVATGGATQQVQVTGQNQPKTTDLNSTVGAALGTIIPSITPSIPTATDKVEVTAPREKTNISIPSVGGAALGSVLTPNITNPIPKAQQPTTKKEDPFAKLFTPNNLLSLLSLFGAGAASKSGAGGPGSVNPGDIPRSNPLNYGDDYYNRVQQYYNSYMPEYPRDVATPLREWYGNGTSTGTAIPGQPTGIPSNTVSSPSSVVGSLFGSMVSPQQANPVVEPAQRSQVSSFRTLPAEQQQAGADYLKGVVPVLAQRSLESGSGWNDFSQLSNNLRATPEDLLSFMSPEQKKQFEDRFSYQLGQNSRLYDPSRTFTRDTAEFTPNIPAYLQQAAALIPNASPEVRKELERLVYSGNAIGGAPVITNESLFNVPFWNTVTKAEDVIAGTASGNIEEYLRNKALDLAARPLRETISNADSLGKFGSIGNFDVVAMKDQTPYIESVNLFGDRPIERLKGLYGLNDEQITDLISLIPIEAFNPNKRAVEEEGYVPYQLQRYVRGYKNPNPNTLSPEETLKLIREGLSPTGG